MATAHDEESDKLEYIKKPELVVGLVGPVGLDWAPVIDVVKQEFLRVDYETVSIRLSHLLEEIYGTDKRGEDEDQYWRLVRLMTQGDSLREDLEHADAVALLSIAAIQRARQWVNEIRKQQARKKCREETIQKNKANRQEAVNLPEIRLAMRKKNK